MPVEIICSKRDKNCEHLLHYRVKHLVGRDHPTIWQLIEVVKKEECYVKTQILQEQRGQPMVKRVRRTTKELQTRLKNLCQEYSAGNRQLDEFLTAIAHNIRFGVERMQE